MTISLSPQTQKLLEDRMRKGGFPTPDDAIRAALQISEATTQLDLDDETSAALEEGEAQIDRGECRPWEQVRDEIRTRFLDR